MSAVNFTDWRYTPIKYEGAPKYGFILFPHSLTNLEGWGEPFIDESSGAPIVPGTEGGSNPNRFLSYKGFDTNIETGEQSHVWKSFQHESKQVAGPIDWKGPMKDSTKRWVLSYWGPNTRHFNFGNFEYGSDTKHKEIYLEGKILTVAPFPVLGAAVKKITYQNEQERFVTETWLIAVLKNGGNDELWMKPLPSPINYELVTDEWREQQEEIATPANEYQGWIYISVMLDQGGKSSDTPWFFNESATEARHIRRHEMVFDPGDGSTAIEDAFVQYRLRVTLSGEYKNGVFTSLGLDPQDKFDYHEQCNKYRRTWDYQSDPDERWQEDVLELDLSLYGQMIIAVDFRGDELITAYLEVNNLRSWTQYWELGIGANNSGRTNGEEVPHTDYSLNDPSQVLPGWRQTAVWAYMGEDMSLAIYNESTGETDLRYYLQYVLSGTQTMFDKGINDNSDWILYFWEGIWNYLHHLDLRSLMMAGRAEAVSNFFSVSAGFNRFSNLMWGEWFQPGISRAREPFTNNTNGVDNGYGFYNLESDWNIGYAEWVDSFPRAVMETWAETISEEISLTTYKGSWLYPNEGEAIYQPYYWDAWDGFWDTLGPFYKLSVKMSNWPIEHIFGDPRAYRQNCVCGTDEKGNHIAYFDFEYHQTGETDIAYGLYPKGDLIEVMTYGDLFSPGGVF